MYAQWLNDLFDRDYDNVMNRVIEYVSYDGGGNYSGDANNTDDDDDDNNENDDDKKGEPFWLREYDRRKLVLCIVKALAMYYNNYIYKKNLYGFLQDMNVMFERNFT
jgi:hypothetical protein